MDLLTGWNFDRKEDRQAAEEHLDRDQPLLLIGSPMCTMFSNLQNMSEWNEKKEERIRNAEDHIKWVCQMYRR